MGTDIQQGWFTKVINPICDLKNWALSILYALRRYEYHPKLAPYIGWIVYLMQILIVIGFLLLVGYYLLVQSFFPIPTDVKEFVNKNSIESWSLVGKYLWFIVGVFVLIALSFEIKLTRYPRRRSNKIIPIGLGFSLDFVKVKDLPEVIRCRRDIIKEFERITVTNDISKLFRIYSFNDYLTSKIHRNFSTGDFKLRLIKKTKIPFIIFGYPKKYEKYKFDLNYVVGHRQIPYEKSVEMGMDFTAALRNQAWEFTADSYGLMTETVASNIEHNALFALGTAAIVSGYTFVGRQVLEKLKTMGLRSAFERRVDKYLGDSYFINSKVIFIKKEVNFLEDAIDELIKGIEIRPDCFDYHMLLSYFYFIKRDIPRAIEETTKASGCSNPNSSWKFNKAFLLLYEGKIDEAVNVYNSIERRHLKAIPIDNYQSIVGTTLDVIDKGNKLEFYYPLIFTFAKGVEDMGAARDYLQQFKNKYSASAGGTNPGIERLIGICENLTS